jgi:hypothetical protein
VAGGQAAALTHMIPAKIHGGEQRFQTHIHRIQPY